MIQDMTRLAGSVAALPMNGLARGLQTLSSGTNALLDLEVKRHEDAMIRSQYIERILRAAADPGVSALMLRLEAPPGSWAATQDLRLAIQRFRKAGKPVYAWLETPSNALVYIAAVCDEIFMLPTGEVSLLGVGAELTFFGALFERLGIQPDFEAAGAYKSFGEPYTRSFASPANQEAIKALVDDLQEHLVRGIADGRRLTPEHVREAIRRAPLSAKEALDLKLVDRLCYFDEMEHWIEEHHGKRIRRVDFEAWARRDALAEWTERWGDGAEQIAIVHMDGPIVVDERGPAIMVRARKVVPLIKKLREDDNVKAVVLHVNSPGGSAVASDMIWREVDLLQRKKPVIACFEDVAASGGYYLAAPAVEIVARPTTLTGSIGVFGGKLVVAEGMRRLGVHVQEFSSAPNATMYSATRHFSEEQRIRFRASLQRFYDGFVHRVAAGRRRPVDQVEPYCRGRVWTGQLARDNGLVDRHGDLLDALDRARVLAGLHRGAFRRQDHSAQPPRSILARALHGAIRSLIPGGARARLFGLAERILGGPLSAQMELIVTHPEQPLAMLPFEIHLD